MSSVEVHAVRSHILLILLSPINRRSANPAVSHMPYVVQHRFDEKLHHSSQVTSFPPPPILSNKTFTVSQFERMEETIHPSAPPMLDEEDSRRLSDDQRQLNDDPSSSNFIEEMYEILECPVCLNHMTPPIIMCECGHNICFKCRPFMTKCPLCRGSFLKTRNVALELIARKIGLSSDDCHKEVNALQEGQSPVQISQTVYTCPFTLYTHCYWQGNYSDIRNHMEEMHASKILIEETTSTWEMNLVVKDFKVIFALNEIFFYKERLDTTNSKFYVQVFYVGQERHSHFSYRLEINSMSGKRRCSVSNVTLPIEDLEHTYTYSHSHCTILDYSLVSNMSKHGDLKCKLSIERNTQ